MTICIGAICENRSKGVIASDRMVTNRMLSIEFEHDEPKFEILSDNCVALTAGEALAPTELFRAVKPKIQDSPDIKDIAEAVAQAFRKFKRKRIEHVVLSQRNLTFDSFLEKQQKLLPEIVIRIDSQIAKAKMNLFILLVGIDESGARIFAIVDPGHAVCFDRLGFHAIGSGLPHAASTFISYDYTPAFSLKKAAYVVYEAKKIAEKAPGVGEGLDMAIVDEEGVKPISEKDIKILDDAYKQRIAIAVTQSQKMDKLINALAW